MIVERTELCMFIYLSFSFGSIQPFRSERKRNILTDRVRYFRIFKVLMDILIMLAFCHHQANLWIWSSHQNDIRHFAPLSNVVDGTSNKNWAIFKLQEVVVFQQKSCWFWRHRFVKFLFQNGSKCQSTLFIFFQSRQTKRGHD